jgi:hypothetical protein
MISDPLEIALREVAETRCLLEALISASECVDPFRAQATLQELRTKVRSLGKLHAKLSAQQSNQLGHAVGVAPPVGWERSRPV